MRVAVAKELGEWTVRVNGRFVFSCWREAKARRLAMNLIAALEADA